MRKYGIVGLVLAVILVIVGFALRVPERSIGWDVEEYVGGDAYNYIIEGEIRAGEIAGTKASKTIYIIGGSIVGMMSLLVLGYETDKKKIAEVKVD